MSCFASSTCGRLAWIRENILQLFAAVSRAPWIQRLVSSYSPPMGVKDANRKGSPLLLRRRWWTWATNPHWDDFRCMDLGTYMAYIYINRYRYRYRYIHTNIHKHNHIHIQLHLYLHLHLHIYIHMYVYSYGFNHGSKPVLWFTPKKSLVFMDLKWPESPEPTGAHAGGGHKENQTESRRWRGNSAGGPDERLKGKGGCRRLLCLVYWTGRIM